MAGPIYDRDKGDQDLTRYTPSELRDLKRKYSTRQDELEDKAIEKGANPADLPRGGMGRALREKSEGDATDRPDVSEPFREGWQGAKAEGATAGQGFYTEGDLSTPSAKSFLSRRRALGLGIGATIFAIIFGLLSYLNLFKLDHIMSNIDAKSFARLNAGLNVRNTDYIKTYMELRLADICPSAGDCSKVANPDNLIFRSGQVQTGNPIQNWYRTLRASNFEQDVFNNHGIILTSESYRENGVIKFRTAKITFNGTDIRGVDINQVAEYKDLVSAISSGDWSTFSKLANSTHYSDFIKSLPVETFESNAARRAAVTEFVNDNTQFYNVFKRRQLRKDIKNLTGITDWRFFDDTRTKVDAKKLQVRNKILDAITPSDTKTGKFLDCLFGISDCKFTEDVANPADEAGLGLTGANPQESVTTDSKNAATAAQEGAKTIDYSVAKETIQKAVGTLAGILNVGNWASTLNSLAHVDKELTSTNAGLAAQVAVARGVQAMALYQVYETARDQIKTGQANPDEVNQFMQTLQNTTASEGWIKTVDGSGNPTTLTNNSHSQSYCDATNTPKEGDFAYLCSGAVIGGASGAKTLQTAYSSGIGKFLHPILSGYSKTFGWFGNLFNSIFGTVVNPIISTVIQAIPGLENTMNGFMSWATGQLAGMLGAGPIINSSTTSGQIGNWLVQGAAFSAESSARENGAALTNPASQKTAQGVLADYQTEETSQMSTYQRYLSPSNPTSPIANSLFAISQLKWSNVASFLFSPLSLIKPAIGIMSLPFTGHASADSADNGYVPAEVAGNISTYDFPSQCYNLDPITMTPANGTNIQKVLGNVPTSDLTWSLVTNSDQWYAYVYKKAGNNSAKAEQIYNCNLLDNSVRGSLGYVYGYTDDNGLNDNSSSSPSSPSAGSCGGSGNYAALVGTGSSFAGTDQGIDFVPTGSSSYEICAPAAGTITLADQTGHHYDRTTGQALVIEKLDQSPSAPSSSQYIYYAELVQLDSNVTVGTHVDKGGVIGTNSQTPGIEVGWGKDATHGFLCLLDPSNPGNPTSCGNSFRDWVAAGGGS